ncbi:MAG: nicotinamide riboside transporter PnuC [Bacteroidales bacterium]|nr:nicotinamide riboside transporter PnuC [Bacteroidales bacterium]
MNDFFDIFYQNLLNTTLLESIAVVFGLLSVWYAKKENILVYPTGIISVLIYVYICLHAGLYADMGINGFYFVMSVYGWYKWTRKDIKDHFIPISSNTRLQHFLSIAGTVVFFFILRFTLINFTDSTVPNIDAATTAIFIIGMWLMALKKIENWIYWIIGDVVSIPLYFHKGLMLTSFQYTVFLVLAISGYLEWRNKMKEQANG